MTALRAALARSSASPPARVRRKQPTVPVVVEAGRARLVDRRMRVERSDFMYLAFLETQDFRPPDEHELLFTAYAYKGGEVMGVVRKQGHGRRPAPYEIGPAAPRVVEQQHLFRHQLIIDDLHIDQIGGFGMQAFVFIHIPLADGIKPDGDGGVGIAPGRFHNDCFLHARPTRGRSSAAAHTSGRDQPEQHKQAHRHRKTIARLTHHSEHA